MTRKIAATDCGMYYHKNALTEPKWAHLIDARLYLPELTECDLEDMDVFIATCRSNPELLIPHRDMFRRFLDDGRTIIALGLTGPEHWLPNVEARDVDINYWWWLEQSADSGVRMADPDHEIFTVMGPDDMNWHHHARFTPPPGARPILNFLDEGCIFYEDTVSTRGRMLITSLDPFFHHGSFFMPAATRFLEKFMPWVKAAG